MVGTKDIKVNKINHEVDAVMNMRAKMRKLHHLSELHIGNPTYELRKASKDVDKLNKNVDKLHQINMGNIIKSCVVVDTNHADFLDTFDVSNMILFMLGE